MDWSRFLASDGRTVLEAARTDPAAAVRACQGWTLNDLVRHLALIHQRTAYLLRTGALERPSQRGGQLEPAPDADADVVPWAERWLDELVARLRDTPGDTEMWSFFPGVGTAAWWGRRMAHETAVHRVDAERALGRPAGPIDADLAVDGIDEVVDVFLPTFGTPPFGRGETVHLHATDAEGEWLLTLGEDAVVVERGHAKGDAAVRGPAAALYLWLWGRGPLQSLEVFGDASVPGSLRSAVARSTG